VLGLRFDAHQVRFDVKKVVDERGAASGWDASEILVAEVGGDPAEAIDERLGLA
jgi:hypothetical protein